MAHAFPSLGKNPKKPNMKYQPQHALLRLAKKYSNCWHYSMAGNPLVLPCTLSHTILRWYLVCTRAPTYCTRGIIFSDAVPSLNTTERLIFRSE